MDSNLGAVTRFWIFHDAVPNDVERLCRGFTEFDSAVDEGRELLNPFYVKIKKLKFREREME